MKKSGLRDIFFFLSFSLEKYLCGSLSSIEYNYCGPTVKDKNICWFVINKLVKYRNPMPDFTVSKSNDYVKNIQKIKVRLNIDNCNTFLCLKL